MMKLDRSSLPFVTGILLFALSVLCAPAARADKNIDSSHFVWGVEIGSSIDVSGYDTSTIDADLLAGYKGGIIRTLGIGTGIHRAFGTDNTFVPVYALFRSSFSTRPRLCFLHLQVGYSFNTLGSAPTFGDSTATVGIGFNLGHSRRYMSHIILGYGFRHFDVKHRELTNIPTDNVQLAQLVFGLTF